MSGFTYDTLAVSRRLQQGGFTPEQAEALATEQARLISDQLSTKADVAGIELQIEALRADVRRLELKTETVRADLIREVEVMRGEMLREFQRSNDLNDQKLRAFGGDLTNKLTRNLVATVVAAPAIIVALILLAEKFLLAEKLIR